MARLVSLIQAALVAPKRRRATRPPKSVDMQRLATKRQRSRVKARRSVRSDEGE